MLVFVDINTKDEEVDLRRRQLKRLDSGPQRRKLVRSSLKTSRVRGQVYIHHSQSQHNVQYNASIHKEMYPFPCLLLRPDDTNCEESRNTK